MVRTRRRPTFILRKHLDIYRALVSVSEASPPNVMLEPLTVEITLKPARRNAFESANGVKCGPRVAFRPMRSSRGGRKLSCALPRLAGSYMKRRIIAYVTLAQAFLSNPIPLQSRAAQHRRRNATVRLLPARNVHIQGREDHNRCSLRFPSIATLSVSAHPTMYWSTG